MLRAHSKERPRTEALPSIHLSQLSYTTVGCYFYSHESNRTYQETVMDVFHYSKRAGIPYRSVLLDSWWYGERYYGGMYRWDQIISQRSSYFPDGGLEALHKATNWPLILHAGLWVGRNTEPLPAGSPRCSHSPAGLPPYAANSSYDWQSTDCASLPGNAFALWDEIFWQVRLVWQCIGSSANVTSLGGIGLCRPKCLGWL